MTFAATVSMKGGGDPHAERLLAKRIDGLGCQEVTVRTDGEPSICELIRRVRELRAEGTTTVEEVSPPGDSAGNGIAESAILTVGGLVRTTKAVVDEKVLEGRNAGPRLIAWMVHHAAQVICACMVGADGPHAIQTIKGTQLRHTVGGFRRTRVAQGPGSGKSKQVQPGVHRGEIARVLPQVILLHRGGFRLEVSHGPIKRANADDRWKVVSEKDLFSAADLESTPAEFTCPRGTRGEVNPAAQRLERHPVDAFPTRPRS